MYSVLKIAGNHIESAPAALYRNLWTAVIKFYVFLHTVAYLIVTESPSRQGDGKQTFQHF